MSNRDCQEDTLQEVTEDDNKRGASRNQFAAENLMITADNMHTMEREKRSQRLNEKGLQYRKDQLKSRREKLSSKLLRKSGMINDMLYSSMNASAVREEMNQVDDMLKMWQMVHEEYHCMTNILLTDYEIQEESDSCEQFDEQIFTFKHTVIKWLKETEQKYEEVAAPSKSRYPRSF